MGVRHLAIQFDTPLLIFLLIPFFKPGCIYFMAPTLSVAFNFWLLVAVGIIIAVYLLRGRMSKIILALAWYETVIFISTLINKGALFEAAKEAARVIALCMLIELSIKSSPRNLIISLLVVLGIECIVNSITILAFPSGMFKSVEQFSAFTRWSQVNNWFLGYDNAHILFIMPLACAFWIYATYKQLRRPYKIVGFVIVFGTVYVTWAAASVIAVTLYCILFLLSEFQERLAKWRVFKFKYLVVLIAAIFLGLVVFKIQNYFAAFIVDVLGKDITLSGRTVFWTRTLAVIAKHPVLGVGVKTRVENFALIGAPHPHDYYLRIMFQSGIVGMISFLIIVVLVVKALNNQRNKYCYILSSTLFCVFVIFLTESFDSIASFFGIMTIAYHINKLTTGLSEAREQTDSPLTGTLKCGES